MSKLKKEEKKDIVIKEENEDEGGNVNWWEQEQIQFAMKGEKRWDTLCHNGVMFPPPYAPHGIPILYEGRKFVMTPEEEEVATMFAVLREHDYYRNQIFRENFFLSWRKILDRRPHPIRSLELCDFTPIYEWHLREREKRLSRTREEKKELKLIADKEAEPYKWCIWDGRREQVANFRVEPPGLFRGRGCHPKMGTLKKRLVPEDIVINIGEESPIPTPPAGHRWGAVIHNHNVTWLAMWKENVSNLNKYVMLAPSSAVKGQSDLMKFEKARELKDHIDEIRESYHKDFKSGDLRTAQRAVATYFIDKLALRVGNEKCQEDEADTVGCCSLRKEHIELKPNNVVKFDFLGKDSIRYENEAVVLPEVYALLQKFTKRKMDEDDIFDQISPTLLNKYLSSFMEGLTAKVFRTYNASITLDQWFKEKPVQPNSSLSDKLAYFNKANTEVAILCNHQRSIPKSYHNTIRSLKSKSGYTRTILEALRRANEIVKTKSVEHAAREFFKELDAMQYAWLDAYGTEEEKKEYDEIVKNRSFANLNSSKAGSKSGVKKASSKNKSKGKNKNKSKGEREANGKSKAKTSKTKSKSKTNKKGKSSKKASPPKGKNGALKAKSQVKEEGSSASKPSVGKADQKTKGKMNNDKKQAGAKRGREASSKVKWESDD